MDAIQTIPGHSQPKLRRHLLLKDGLNYLLSAVDQRIWELKILHSEHMPPFVQPILNQNSWEYTLCFKVHEETTVLKCLL